MASSSEVKQQIRFGLEQLSIQNAQHEFEHLARDLSRKRICSNIIPATGPVQVGGDQGRDFETFRTFLTNSPLANSAFIGLATEKTIAFACSLEQNPVKKSGKIERDINVITRSGSKVDCICFFSSRDIPISERHKTQEWARKEKSIELEIFDSQAIAELLSEPDVFWIANKYLNIPNEIYPRPIQESDWYKNLLATWRDKTKINFSFEEFEEIKSGARNVYKTDELKPDLPFWLEKLELFRKEDVLPILRRRATYEICVDALVGFGNIVGKEALVREYFRDIGHYDDIPSLEDAVVLLSFVTTATWLNAIYLDKRELISWKDAIDEKISIQLENAVNSNNRCCLLEIKSFTNITFNLERRPESFVKNFEEYVNTLEQIFEFLPTAPLFPLERLTERIKETISILLENHVPIKLDRLESIAQRIDDEFLAVRFGAFKAGQNYKDRAMLYFSNNQILKAIKLLHKAKLKWFADETLRGSLLCILMLSECYQQLSMNYAAKYYALAAAHLAINTGKPELYQYFSRAIAKSASCEYGAGAWIGYFDLMESLLLARNVILKDPLDISEDSELRPAVYHSVLIRYFAERFAPDLICLIEDKIKKLGQVIQGDIAYLLQAAKEGFGKYNDTELWQLVNEKIYYEPFNDIGPNRTIAWNVFGIEWRFDFVNNYRTTCVAEQFIAVLQILQVELANVDLHNLKGVIVVDVKVEGTDKPSFTRDNTNKESKWCLKLPDLTDTDKEEIKQAQTFYMAFATSMLYEFSLLPREEFYQLIEDEFKEGLSAKLTIAQPYEILYRNILPEKEFLKSQKQNFEGQLIGKDYKLNSNDQLKWNDKISPKYNKDNAFRHIKNRYKFSLKPIAITLEKIKNKVWFKEIIKELRTEKWRDWHLLIAIMNQILSYKTQLKCPPGSEAGNIKKHFQELFDKPEKETYIEIPKDVLSLDNIKIQLDLLFSNFVITWKLEAHNEVPNIDGLKEFFKNRFCIMTDDITHQEIF